VLKNLQFPGLRGIALFGWDTGIKRCVQFIHKREMLAITFPVGVSSNSLKRSKVYDRGFLVHPDK
jgi:hypothetical protein